MGDDSRVPNKLLSRREVLKRGTRAALGVAAAPVGLASLSGLLSSCGTTPIPSSTPTATSTPPPIPSSTPTATSTPPPSLTPRLAGQLRVSLSDYLGRGPGPDELAGMAEVDAAFAARTGLSPQLSSIVSLDEHLEGAAADVALCVGFCGDNLRTRAAKGLLAPTGEVWAESKASLKPAFAPAVTGPDGRQYGVPVLASPWFFFYSRTLWQSAGYEVPRTFAELVALCARMRSDHLVPVDFGAMDLWTVSGTFDMLDLRLNGLAFHRNLAAGKARWTDNRVLAVFKAWKSLGPFDQAAFGATARQAIARVVDKRAGLLLLPVSEVATFGKGNPAVEDLDFFEFPYFANEWDVEKAVATSLDSLVVPAKSQTLAGNLANASAYLRFWAEGSSQVTMAGHLPGRVPTAADADVSQLDRLSRQAFDLVAASPTLALPFTNEVRPDFGSQFGYFLDKLLDDSSKDMAALATSIQAFWDGLPARS